MRPSLHDYFMKMARVAAERATCPRKHVGVVIVRDKHVVVTGYNGSIRGMAHCDTPGVGCLMEDGHCVRTVHAEENAIIQAAEVGRAVGGTTMYVTASPCWLCFKMIANAGIVEVVFGETYRAEDPGPRRVVEVAEAVGIKLVDFTALSCCLECGFEGLTLKIPLAGCPRCGGQHFKSYETVVST